MAQPELAALLRRVRARIEDKRHWTQGAEARAKNGHGMDYLDKRAVRWCVLGACYREALIDPFNPPDRWYEMALTATLLLGQEAAQLIHVPPECELPAAAYYNDTQGHEKTLALLDAAIARAEAGDGG